ncbi:MAG: acyl carrier protein [Clostridiales bacterium]|jgi:acyl carrier protein|nr:acyl carrier protein [Clostridiales bacterium]HOB64531.1 acyl carrier protein [Clostridia bacterium]HOK81835.1 acyl carrier protein [Clostridia bacterium]HOL60866.1 acyl carrier protein [Clostridia bacterium]HPO53562.1 acyl carrier protein [Clostridia bacterium]
MIFQKVKKLIAEQLGIPADDITEDSDFINDLNADSLDIVQMLISLESEFGLEFGDDEIKAIKTVGDVVKFIENHRAG